MSSTLAARLGGAAGAVALVMWMGSGMAPVMFSGIQHYISQMGMGMAAPSFPPIHNPMQLPRVPLDQSISVSQTPNQTLMCQTPILGAFNYQNQMQNSALLEQYARYIGYHLMQSAPQAVQHSQTTIPPSNSNGPMSGVANIDDAVSGKMGTLSLIYSPSKSCNSFRLLPGKQSSVSYI